ncbi:MAG: carboxypeptidase-like regulatory domain-containing protein [Myxococcota bacterium]|jgi:hypothetical protein|nr:carboxypeptidase-like regulatory domain-containing protein [Myxococcota bacterium]
MSKANSSTSSSSLFRYVRSALLSSLAVLAIGGLLIACGTTRISGRVVDDRKKPIKAASVETDPPTDFIVTNHIGAFTIERFLDETNTAQPLKPGSYKVTIKKLGYKDKVIPVDVKERAEATLGDIVLNRKQIEMEALDDVEGNKSVGPGAGDLPPPVLGE